MISIRDAVRIIESHRGDSIVVASQCSRVPWAKVSRRRDLDITFAGCMSKESSVALGIALACPDRKVIVLSGDGELLMNLGTLVTIAGQSPSNLYHFLLRNGVYANTGGQPTPGAGTVDFVGLARDAGYSALYEFDDLESLATEAEAVLAQDGPVFVCLDLEPEAETRSISARPRPWRPLRESLPGLRRVLTQ